MYASFVVSSFATWHKRTRRNNRVKTSKARTQKRVINAISIVVMDEEEAEQPQLELYQKGVEVWLPSTEKGEAYRVCIVEKLLADGQVKLQDGTIVRRPPPLKNGAEAEQVDDLTQLTYLNEPSVLHTIQLRYLQEADHQIYTYSGLVLVAVNPFSNLLQQ